MIRLAIFHSDLGVGGQQRALISMLNALDLECFEAVLFVVRGGCFEKDVPSGVKLIFLEKQPRIIHYLPYKIARRFSYFNSVSQEGSFDLAIDYSSFYNECAIAVNQCQAKHKIVWIHTDFMMARKLSFKHRIALHLSKPKFNDYQHVISVSQGAAESFSRMFGFKRNEIVVFPNIIDYKVITDKLIEEPPLLPDSEKTNFVFLGRLSKTKRVDKILASFFVASEYRKDIALYIIGDGSMMSSLKKQVRSSIYRSNVYFLGSLENPYPLLALMDCLILLSDYEGQGIVIQEAQFLGLKVIAGKNLEKYNADLIGVDDPAQEILNTVKKKEKTIIGHQHMSGRAESLTQMLSELL